MCFSVDEGHQMLDAAALAGVRLMVGYPLRYDPAYQRLAQELAQLDDLRLVRVTTLESPIPPYVDHYSLIRPADLPAEAREAARIDDDARVTVAIGDQGDGARHVYRWVLLDTLVHEFNALRGVLGEPDRLAFVDLREQAVTSILDFGGVHCVIAWVDLPGIARYEMEFGFYAPDRRLTLTFPSPFLRSMPTRLTIEGGEPGGPRSWSTTEVASYDEAFKRELIAFHDYVTNDRESPTPGTDGLRDIALCEAAVAAFRDGVAYPRPTEVPRAVSAPRS